MKVRALFHILQTIGSIQVERVAGTVFDLNDTDATASAAAGIVKIVNTPAPTNATVPSPTSSAKSRQTKVTAPTESK